MDQSSLIGGIAFLVVGVVVCGVISSRLVTGTPVEWNTGMMTEVKIFALTGLLVAALAYLMVTVGMGGKFVEY